MKATVRKFAVCAALLFGGLLPVAIQAGEIQGRHNSGVVGVVNVGQFDGGLMPGIWDVAIAFSTGELLAVVQTDEEGFFVVDLKPGNYLLTPSLPPPMGPGPFPNFVIYVPPTSVEVDKNHFALVVLPVGGLVSDL